MAASSIHLRIRPTSTTLHSTKLQKFTPSQFTTQCIRSTVAIIFFWLKTHYFIGHKLLIDANCHYKKDHRNKNIPWWVPFVFNFYGQYSSTSTIALPVYLNIYSIFFPLNFLHFFQSAQIFYSAYVSFTGPTNGSSSSTIHDHLLNFVFLILKFNKASPFPVPFLLL